MRHTTRSWTHILTALLLLASAAPALQAQDGLSASVTTQDAAPVPTPDSSVTESEKQAALEMIEVMGMDDTLDLSMRQMIDVQIQRNPQLAPMRDVFEDFFDTYLSWEQLKGEFVMVYARTFSESEMREIITFYNTPTGQKMLEALPGLIAETNAIGINRIQTHAPELQQALEQRQQELQAQAGGMTPAPEATPATPPATPEEVETPEDTPPN